MTLADILSTDPGAGRARIMVPGYPVTLILPCHARDIHAMGRFKQWCVGALTPGETMRDGIAISEFLLALQPARDIIDLFLHENTHWWQLWRRMGPTDFPAGYVGQIIAKLLRRPLKENGMSLHDRINIEAEAIASASAMMTEIDALLRVSQPATFDMLPWLEQHLPALRA